MPFAPAARSNEPMLAACPMQIKVSTGKAVRDHQCISCHECLSGAACPVEDTVIVSAGKGGAEA